MGVELVTVDADIEAEGEPGVPEPAGVAEPDFVGVGLSEGLLLGVPEGQEVSEGVGDAVAPDDAEDVGVAVSFEVEEPADIDSDADADADADGEVQPLGLSDGVAPPEAAIPAVAGMTSRAPIATVPVATAPATEAADRPALRACLGTVPTPSFSCSPCIRITRRRGRTVPP